VRIAINSEELKKTPLRPGLSTITSINVSAPESKPTNDSIVKTASSEYSTEVFDKDLAEAKTRAEKIIKENIIDPGDGADSCAAAQ
jgi:membrane fusion protein (multidrug efflux system)